MVDSYIRVNIAIKPPKNVIKEVVRISSEINKSLNPYFVLDNIHFFPHITLYSPEYPAKNLDSVIKTVKKVTQSFRPFLVSASAFRSHLGYIDIALEKNSELNKLHEIIVNELNPLREDHVREAYRHTGKLTQYSNVQQEYIQKYGYSEVFTSFTPHMTITRIPDHNKAKEIANTFTFPYKKFEIARLAAYSMSSHGTCTGILEEFTL